MLRRTSSNEDCSLDTYFKLFIALEQFAKQAKKRYAGLYLFKQFRDTLVRNAAKQEEDVAMQHGGNERAKMITMHRKKEKVS